MDFLQQQEKLRSGDVRKVKLTVKEMYPNQDNFVPLDIEYRLFITVGEKYEIDVVPFTHSDMGVAMLSGFSTELLKSVITGKDFTPMSVYLKAIGGYKIPPVLKYEKINIDDIDIERICTAS